jgi:hypothetical protein
MTLTELQAGVYSLTNRPDLTGQTLIAIQSATLEMHQMDFFYRDLVESGIVFPTAEYLQSLEYRVLFPTWRALKYFRTSDSSGEVTSDPFEVIEAEDVLDQYKLNRTNVVYGAGEILQIKAAAPFQYAFLAYYANPIITQIGYNSWIARDHPFAIIYKAASDICRQIGKQEQSAMFAKEVMDKKQAITISNVQVNGY